MDYTEWQAVDYDFVVRIDNHIITQLTAYRQKTSKQPESLGLLVGFALKSEVMPIWTFLFMLFLMICLTV